MGVVVLCLVVLVPLLAGALGARDERELARYRENEQCPSIRAECQDCHWFAGSNPTVVRRAARKHGELWDHQVTVKRDDSQEVRRPARAA